MDPVLYDAEAVVASLTPPRYKYVSGREVEGRFVSHREFRAAIYWYGVLYESGMPIDEWTEKARAFFDAVFPPTRLQRLAKRLARWLPAWVPRPMSVADDVLALPFRRQQDAFMSFWNCLAPEYVDVKQPKPSASEPGPTSQTTSQTTSTDSASPSPTSSLDSSAAIPAST